MSKTGLNISTISRLLNVQVFGTNSEICIKHLSIDSRTLAHAHECLFFALKDKRDGHDFIATAYEAGVRAFVVQIEWFKLHKNKLESHQVYPDAVFLLVDDPLQALQNIAKTHRKQFNLPLIGITGSNGKTLVKEWLFQLLQGDFQIRRNPKSYNSQIGLALSLWELQAKDNLAIFEAGISKPAEMHVLEEMMCPNIGILTNIGTAHNAGFENLNQKLHEKLKLFKGVETLIYNPKYIPNADFAELNGPKKFTWAYIQSSIKFDQTINLQLQIISTVENQTEIKASYLNNVSVFKVPFQDLASLENVASCLATMLVLDFSLAVAVGKLKFLHPVKMRMTLLGGINECSIIDDTYSADLNSLQIALDFLSQQKQHPETCLILTDVLETGLKDAELYHHIARLIKNKGVNRFIGVGPEIATHQALFPKNALFFQTTEDLLLQVEQLNFFRETILIKGARKFQLERLTTLLSAKAHDTQLEINLRAINDNLQAYRQELKPGVKIMAMVKAFSYGSGSYEVANVLAFQKVDYLAVAYADEGVALRKAGIKLPIMVMSPEPSAFQLIWDYKLEPEIYSLEILKAYLKFLGFLGVDKSEKEMVPIHLKFDTGMHRLGFENVHLDILADILHQNPQFKVQSIFSHLVGADNPEHDEFTKHQISSFQDMFNSLCATWPIKPIRHILNSAGISRFTEAQFDMVRLGIGLYALDDTFKGAEELQSVLVWKTTVSQVKELETGETVGYGRRGKISQPTTVATVKVGYADGYSRKLGNGFGFMFIQGVQVPTIGSICMDMCMLDVSKLVNLGIQLKPGDEVVLFDSPQGVEMMAKQLETIPYEIICNISQRVKRVYYYE